MAINLPKRMVVILSAVICGLLIGQAAFSQADSVPKKKTAAKPSVLQPPPGDCSIGGPASVVSGLTYSYSLSCGQSGTLTWSAEGGSVAGSSGWSVDVRWGITMEDVASVRQQAGTGLSLHRGGPSADGMDDSYPPPIITSGTLTAKINGLIVATLSVSIGPPPLVSGSITPSSQSVAAAAIPLPLSISAPTGGNGGAVQYQWQSSFDGTGWNNIPGATNASYGPGTITATTYYRVYTSQGATGVYSAAAVTTLVPGSGGAPPVVGSGLPSTDNATVDLSRPVGTPDGAGGVSADGGSNYSVPIKVLSGTNGMAPNISLVYHSRGGDGVAGQGWNLSGASVISRVGKSNYYNGTNAPVKYTNTDDAFALDGQRLFVTSGTNGADGAGYGLENEQYAKIESFGGSTTLGPDWFRVTTKNGTVIEYGHADNSKLLTDNGNSNMVWLLDRVTDINGNYQDYKYVVDNANRSYSLAEIDYTGNSNTGLPPYNKVFFSYALRDGWQNSTTYDGGASLRKMFGLTNISVRNATGQTVRSYDMAYSVYRGQYYLASVTESGSDGTALNPLVFGYGSNTSAPDLSTTLQYSNMHQGNVYAGDFDGDSKQDVLSVNYSIDNNGIRHDLSYDVLSEFGEYAGQPSISWFYNYTMPPGGAVKVANSENAYLDYLTNDYDGDGKEDVLMINNVSSGSDLVFNGVRVNYSRYFSVYYGPSYDSASYLALPHTTAYSSDFKYVYRNGSTYGRYFVPGDFDGDGAQDYILILGMNSSNQFKAFFSSPKKGIFNKEIAGFGVSGTSTDPFYANSVASATQLLAMDFDGDGKQEILVVTATQSYVLGISNTAGSYSAGILYSFTDIKDKYPVFPGDFNGDGKVDLLYRNTNADAYGSWYILTGTGTAFLSSGYIWSHRVYLPVDNAGSAHHVLVADLDGDGRTDIWHSLDLSSSDSQHDLSYSNGQSFVRESYYATASINGSMTANTVVGDFNGDGKPDILGINSSSLGRFIYIKPFREERFLVSSMNGMGEKQGFLYELLNSSQYGGGVYDRTWYYEYDQYGVPIGTGINGNPYNVLFTPMYVTSYTSRSNGIGEGVNYTSYRYRDAAYSRARGFLGFKAYTSTDNASMVTTGTENGINTDLLVAHPVHQYTYIYPDTLSDIKISDTLLRLNAGSPTDRRYVRQVLKTVSYNGLTGAASESSNTYDGYGNVTQNNTKTGSISNGTVSPVETANTSTTYGTHGTPFPASPDNVTVSNTRNGQPAVSKTTAFTYDAKGNVATKVDFSGLANAVTNTFTYNGFGNVTQMSISANGVGTKTQNFTYDNTGRFILQKEAVGTGISKKEAYTYESVFGNTATNVSTDGLTTSYNYDAFGKLITTNLPEGYSVTQAYAWQSSIGRYSVNVTRPGGGSNVKTYYDLLGREVQKEVSGFNNGTLTSTKTYNEKGQEVNTIQPHYGDESAVTTSSQYDDQGRLTRSSNGTVTNNYSYQQQSGGLYQTTVTNGANQSKSRTQDATGKTVSASDNGGTLNYTYNSQGKQVQVTLNGATAITSIYDAYGNQTSLTDRNAGTITYQYDAYGELTSQTDALGHTTTNVYDIFGRAVSRTGAEGTTTYEYWQEEASGYCNDNVTKITGFGGDVKEYSYDALRRLVTEKVTVDGSVYQTEYAYDSYGNPIKVTYPTGLVITRTYNHDGAVLTVQKGEGPDASALFTGTAMNSLGKYTAYSYGNGKSSTESYNLATGTPTQYLTTGIQNLNFTFDAQTGNLTERKDMVKNMDETFTYDNLNRLLTETVNNVQQQSIAYDGNSGSSLGNIVSKTDAGNYTYNTTKVNAVAYITNPAGAQTPPSVISQDQQDITYTAFQKTATVAENNYSLAYTYGSDYQRIKSVLQQNGATVETKYYMGDYERQTKNGATNDIVYVNGGNGLCAVIVNGAAYYTYSDYLGSILTVTDASGSVTAEQNFDAWGRKRNPTDWSYNNVPDNPDWLYRGYTGHEYLKEFALVNMNGRVYDPVQGRMLSPDNFVQSPELSQSYNRYSYGWNNPLIFIDPTGNSLWGVIKGIGKFIGRTIIQTINPLTIPNRIENAVKIGIGLFAYNSHESVFQNILDVGLRVTWQLPQEAAGEAFAQLSNATGYVNSVSYFDGATVLYTNYLTNSTIKLQSDGTYGSGHSGSAFTLGNFISGPSEMKASPSDPTFVHEYGRYLQSKAQGLAYLFYTAIPNKLWGNNDDYTSHEANARALKYFSAHYGIVEKDFYWDFRNSVGAPIPGYDLSKPISDPDNQNALDKNIKWPW